MPKAVAALRPRPQHPNLIKGREEGNMGPLALISLQERIPESYTSWKVVMHMGAVQGEVSCLSPAEVGGVPHGIDGDVALVLQMLYLEQGSPNDGWVETTPYQILTRAGLEVSGRYYSRLQVSLRRLNSANYTIKRIWLNRSRNQHESVSFAFLAQVEMVGAQAELNEASKLRVKLAEPLTKNVLRGYLRPLDFPFLVSLHRPTARGLYRLLNAVRLSVLEEDKPPVSVYRVGVQDWAITCKMLETEVARIRRNLKEAHEELIERGFLCAVEWHGRGEKATLEYHFADAEVLPPTALTIKATVKADKNGLRAVLDASPEKQDPHPPGSTVAAYPHDPALLEQLRGRGVATSVGRSLLTRWGSEHIEARLKTFEALIQGGARFRSKAAVLVDLIRSEADKYSVTPLFDPPALEASNPSGKNLRPDSENDSKRDPSPAQLEAQFRTLELHSQVERALSQARILLGRSLDSTTKNRLHEQLESGVLDPYTFIQNMNHAGFTHRVDAFITDLRKLLN